MTDDFLHNLRSSHRQRFDRNRKPYDNPQYRKNDAQNTRDRKSGFVRRGMDADAMGGLKKVLEGLLESQKLFTQAVQDMVQAQQRQALALERIAGIMAGPGPAMVPAHDGHPLVTVTAQPTVADLPAAEPNDVSAPGDPADEAAQDEAIDDQGPLPASDRFPQTMGLITDLQKSGYSYERIARHLEHHQVPTPSGRGRWRGSLVSRIIKDQAVAAVVQ